MPFSSSSDSSARTRDTTYGSTFGWFLPMRSAPPAGRLQIALPQVDVHALVGLGRLAPELAAVEPHAVERLWMLAAVVRVRVREHVHTVEPPDDPALAAHIAGQPRVARWVEIARHDSITDRVARPRGALAHDVVRPGRLERPALDRRRSGDGRGRRRIEPLAEEGDASAQIVLAHDALLNEQPRDPVEPFLEVRHAEIVA